MAISTEELRTVRRAAEDAVSAMNPRLASFVAVVANPLLIQRMADAIDPEPTEAMLVAGLRECEPLGELIDWRDGFGRDDMRRTWAAMCAAKG